MMLPAFIRNDVPRRASSRHQTERAGRLILNRKRTGNDQTPLEDDLPLLSLVAADEERELYSIDTHYGWPDESGMTSHETANVIGEAPTTTEGEEVPTPDELL